MKKLISSVLFVLLLTSRVQAVIVTVGNGTPISLPNGRDGSTPIAVYQTAHQLDFTLSEAKSVLVFSTADLYMNACSSTGDARCPYGESVAGNQRLIITDLNSGRVVFDEIFKFALTVGSLYVAGVRPENKPSIKPGITQTSTLHGVTNTLPVGRYQVKLQVRNDFSPMNAHAKRLTVMY